MRSCPAAPRYTVYLLSPANSAGKRAGMLLREGAAFDLARRLRGRGVPLGEAYAFVSGLYFRGKLAYATAFAEPPARRPGVLVITPGKGLLPATTSVSLGDLRRIAQVPVDPAEPRYRDALLRDTRKLSRAAGPHGRIVLLGSIATGKYADLLLEVLGERLCFPQEFVGRGDMSRGGLMLRCAADGRRLTYVPVAGAVRHGPRPPRLVPLRSPPARGASTAARPRPA